MNKLKKHITTFLSFGFIFTSSFAECELYELDILTGQDSTDQYQVSCYTNISSSHWTVNNDSCIFTTVPVELGGVNGDLVSTPISVEIVSAKSTTTCDDYVRIEYQVDDGSWITQDSINTCDIPTSAWGYDFNVICGDTSAIKVRVVYYVVDNSGSPSSEKLRLRDGGLCISAPTPLIVQPIELISFEGEMSNDQVVLTWETASEKENDYFIVEKSIDGNEFEPIGTVLAAGDSDFQQKYEFTDQEPEYGNNYYRLKYVSYDGKKEVASTINVDYDISSSGSNGEFKIFPNPAENGKFNVCLSGSSSKNIFVVLYDAMGNEVYSKVCVQEGNKILTAIDPSQRLAPGVYFVVGSSDDEYYQQKLVIK